MSIPFLYSEQFIDLLKVNIDPKTDLNELIKESIKDGNGNKLFTLNIPNSKTGDILPELKSCLAEIGDFYTSILKVESFGLQAITSPEWMSGKISNHITALTLYKAYLDELSVQAVRQSYFKQEKEAELKVAESTSSEWSSEEDKNRNQSSTTNQVTKETESTSSVE